MPNPRTGYITDKQLTKTSDATGSGQTLFGEEIKRYGDCSADRMVGTFPCLPIVFSILLCFVTTNSVHCYSNRKGIESTFMYKTN